MDYKHSGVDIEAGYKAVELMKKHVARTARPEMLGGLGGFSGAFSMDKFKKHGASYPGVRHRRCGNQAEIGVSYGQARYGGH